MNIKMEKSILGKLSTLIGTRALLLMFVLCCVCTVRAQELQIKVNKKGKVGFVDTNGNEVIKCIYESAYPFKNGVAIVCKSGKYGIIDHTGKVILPLKYNQISSWNNNLYLIKVGKKLGLTDLTGKIILEAKYSLISKSNCYGKALIALGGKATSNEKQTYHSNAKYGIIDNNGKILIEPIYKGLYEFAFDGKAEFPYYEGKRLLYSYHYITDTLKTDCNYLGISKNGFNIYGCGIVDGKGKELLKSGLYNLVMMPSNDMVRYYITKKKETICGYHDLKTGKNITVAEFELPIDDMEFWSHGDFIGDIAPVNSSSWSFIDKSGKVLRTGYESLKHSEVFGLWAAEKASGKWDVFNEQNKDVTTLSGFESIDFPVHLEDEEIYSVKKENVYGCVNREGQIIIPFEYEHILSNTYDIIPIKKNGKWGALTPKNENIVPAEFLNLLLPSERNTNDFWVMKSDSLYYHYKVSENSLSPVGYKAVTNFIEGIAHVEPVNMQLYDTAINRAQMYNPNTDQATISSAKLEEARGAFGYLLGNDGKFVMDKPVSTLYKDMILKKIKAHGYKTLSESKKKEILLQVTEENRSYDLKAVSNEEEWNY